MSQKKVNPYPILENRISTHHDVGVSDCCTGTRTGGTELRSLLVHHEAANPNPPPFQRVAQGGPKTP